MELTDAQICKQMDAIKDLPTCSQWAWGFAESILGQVSKGRTLTIPQKQTCYKILKENSPEEIKKAERWEEDYKTLYKKKGLLVATYYRAQSPAYYGDVALDIVEGRVPNRQKFLKMMSNKYAKKVLSELERPPRFTTDDHIVPNSKFVTGYSYNTYMMETREGSQPRVDVRESFKRRGGIILGVDDKVKSAAKGSKRYLVLPFGSVETYWVEERFLKKKSKVKK